MSEFSDSYHLRADGQQSGVDLLRAAGPPGYVFPAENGWVAVVAYSRSRGRSGPRLGTPLILGPDTVLRKRCR